MKELQQGAAAQLVGACCRDWNASKDDSGKVMISGRFVFPTSFHGFSGHFPEKPILPAVIQLTAVRYLIETSLGQRCQLRSIGRTRFKAMILPDEVVSAEIGLEPVADGWRGSFSLCRADADVVASGMIDIAVQE